VFSVVIGVLMHLIFRKEEMARVDSQGAMPGPGAARPLWQNALYFLALVGILVFPNWARPDQGAGLWYALYRFRWAVTSTFALGLGVLLITLFSMPWWKVALTAAATAAAALVWGDTTPLIPFGTAVVLFSFFTSRDSGEVGEWFDSSWGFAKQIMPLLLWGVLIAGFLLGRPGHEGMIPAEWVHVAVGGNSLRANFFASFAGAFMYFATLTEVPILQGLIGNGMGEGPALALLLAGPALSLPNMLVIRSVIGTRKTIAFVALVVVMATTSGALYGAIVAN
jgi:uncharacterized membrane protein YraQ (UPF0718 family)